MAPIAEIVEVATPKQLEHVRSLIRSYQSGLPGQYCFPDREWQNLPGEYGPPGGALLLATVAGQPAGCVGLRPFALDGACEMKRLYVRPEFRGFKLGEGLIEHIIRVARRLGYSRMRLDTHPPTMGPAVELYRRLGFADVPAWPSPQVDGLSYMELGLQDVT
jgi:GNAT superfamily N-acetyltransferase